MLRIPRVLKSGLWPGNLLLALLAIGCDKGSAPPNGTTNDPLPKLVSGIDSVLETKRTPDGFIDSLFKSNASNVQVLVRGVVVKLRCPQVVDS